MTCRSIVGIKCNDLVDVCVSIQSDQGCVNRVTVSA